MFIGDYMSEYRNIIIILLFLVSIFVFFYNVMLIKRNKASNAFSSLDVMLKKRYDLIPNLVNVVRGYSDFEKSVFTDITKLRNELINSNDKNEILEKNVSLAIELNKLIAYVENYPDLKANKNYLELQKSLYKIEEQISAARRTYNAHVTNYNNFIQFFPNNIFAKIFGFKRLEWFVFEENDNIGVDFDENNR